MRTILAGSIVAVGMLAITPALAPGVYVGPAVSVSIPVFTFTITATIAIAITIVRCATVTIMTALMRGEALISIGITKTGKNVMDRERGRPEGRPFSLQA